MTTRIVVVSGGFDPLHPGHISYLKNAHEMGEVLIVGLNSDEWLIRKKGYRLMSRDDRACILESLNFDLSVEFFDDSDGTAIDLIKNVIEQFPPEDYRIIFANGGDRTNSNIPEMIAEFNGKIEFAFGVGGSNKQNSSTDIVKRAFQQLKEKEE